jgi:hypothetical protein
MEQVLGTSVWNNMFFGTASEFLTKLMALGVDTKHPTALYPTILHDPGL